MSNTVTDPVFAPCPHGYRVRLLCWRCPAPKPGVEYAGEGNSTHSPISPIVPPTPVSRSCHACGSTTAPHANNGRAYCDRDYDIVLRNQGCEPIAYLDFEIPFCPRCTDAYREDGYDPRDLLTPIYTVDQLPADWRTCYECSRPIA